MSQVEIKELFDESRFPSGWKLFTLILYTPIGVIISILRLFIALQTIIAAAILPQLSIVRSFVLRCLCLVLGIVVRQESERDESARIIISNHTSPCDHLPVHVLTGCVTPSLWELPPGILSSALGLKDLGLRQGRDALLSHVTNHLDKDTSSVIVYPEGETTNGRIGLLKFSTWPFCLHEAVQPVAVTTWRLAFADVGLSRLDARPWEDLLWFLFVPFTVFTIKFLPTMRREEGEDEQEFTDRVEAAIALQLNIRTTKHTAGDKAEYVKRTTMEQQRPVHIHSHQPSPTMNGELQRMATQVGEVLPSVPHDVIVKDLLKTRSVDITIANILEGLVPYVPKEIPQPSSSMPRPSDTSSSVPHTSSSSQDTCLDTSAKSFPRSAQERMMSFHERKARLIENARNKYIEKHSLKIAGYNC